MHTIKDLWLACVVLTPVRSIVDQIEVPASAIESLQTHGCCHGNLFHLTLPYVSHCIGSDLAWAKNHEENVTMWTKKSNEHPVHPLQPTTMLHVQMQAGYEQNLQPNNTNFSTWSEHKDRMAGKNGTHGWYISISSGRLWKKQSCRPLLSQEFHLCPNNKGMSRTPQDQAEPRTQQEMTQHQPVTCGIPCKSSGCRSGHYAPPNEPTIQEIPQHMTLASMLHTSCLYYLILLKRNPTDTNPLRDLRQKRQRSGLVLKWFTLRRSIVSDLSSHGRGTMSEVHDKNKFSPACFFNLIQCKCSAKSSFQSWS